MERRQLLPRSDTDRWQVYPSEDEVLMIRMLKKYSGIETNAFMIRVMINYFAESSERQMDLTNYAQTFVRPKYDLKQSRRKKLTAIASKKEKIISENVMSQVNECLEIIQALKMLEEEV